MTQHPRSRHMRTALWSAAAAIGTIASAGAQLTETSEWWLRNRPYYDPVVAEQHGANIKAMLGALDSYPWAASDGARLGMDISVGKEIPIVGAEHGDGNEQMLPGEWGAGLWLPVSFHMLWDLRDNSEPIINNDYRFGAMLKAAVGLGSTTQLGVRIIPWAHESTHLGDELVLAARKRLGTRFERINVSYEFWELAASFERNLSDSDVLQGSGIRYKIRAGLVGLHTDYGFYYADPAEVNPATITLSTSRLEPYAEADLQFPVRLGADWQLFLSADVRSRIVYNYHKTDPAAAEDRQISIDAAVGFSRTNEKRGEKGHPDLYIRLYHGVNPHGQLRSQRDFWMAGIGLNINV